MKTIILNIFISKFIFAQKNDSLRKIDSVVLEILKTKPINSKYTSYKWQQLFKSGVSDTIEKRLLELLNPKWKELEIKEFVKNKFLKDSLMFFELELSKSLSNSQVSKKFDSLKKARILLYNNQIGSWELEKGNSDLLFIVSYLQIKAAIPIIKKHFNSYNKEVAKLALARLGNTEYQKEIISNCKPNDSKKYTESLVENIQKITKLKFIATQESIFAFSIWLDSSQDCGTRGPRPCSNEAVYFLNSILLNEDFKKGVKDWIVPNDVDINDNSNKELINFCKQWLVANKGRYKINYDFNKWD